MLILETVNHCFGRRVALADVNLVLRPGVTGLVGANSAGKTTLLRVASGGLRPTGGDVRIAGDSLYGAGRRRALARVSLMPQASSAPRGLTAIRFVTYLRWMRGANASDAERRAHEALDLVGLRQRAGSRLGTLSGGMPRRVWLAQALAHPADVLLLDEPSTGLDPRQRATMTSLVTELTHRHVLLSSHLIEDIARLADRVIALDAGRVRYDGPRPTECDTRWFLSIVGEDTT